MATVVSELTSRPHTGGTLFSSLKHRKILGSLLLGLITLVIYNSAVHNNFVSFDDPGYITTNRHIHAGLTWDTIKWAFSSTEQANWHPLTWLSHTLDWQLFGARAAGHHYVNVLLHTLCVVLLFLFFVEATGFIGRSAVVAALFAVHPINVETVAWISERKNILCMVFLLLALGSYRAYVRNPNLKRYMAIVLWFALGLMSKPMIVTFPFVLLLLDYWPLERMNFASNNVVAQISPNGDVLSQTYRKSLWKLLLEKVPFFALTIASAVITMVAQKGGGAVRTEFPLPVRLMNAIVSYTLYIEKAIWPAHLSVLYPHPGNMIPLWKVIASSLFLAAITCVVLKLRRHRYLIVGWLWFLGTLIPVIGLVQVGEQALADRYAYLPFIGLFIAAVWGLADWAHARQIHTPYIATAAMIAIAGLSIVTHVQIGYWRDSTALWSRALEVTQRNFVAHDNMGTLLLQEGRIEEAAKQFQAAAAINPHDPFSQLNIGVCEKQQGNIKAAIAHYESALQLSTEPMLRSTAFGNLGAIYHAARDYSRARKYYEAALNLHPDNQFALIGMGLITQSTGDVAHAIDYYSHAVEVAPSDVGYLLLAQAFHKAGQEEKAQSAFAEAKMMSSNLEAAQQETNAALQEKR
jgi:tetratricopeptide (TPR) repeat protein